MWQTYNNINRVSIIQQYEFESGAVIDSSQSVLPIRLVQLLGYVACEDSNWASQLKLPGRDEKSTKNLQICE
jgi:hypothetical protein